MVSVDENLLFDLEKRYGKENIRVRSLGIDVYKRQLLAPVTVNPLKVPATISVKAAITSKVNNQENRRNNFLPVLPMYFSCLLYTSRCV